MTVLTAKDSTTFETELGDELGDVARTKIVVGGSDPIKFAPNVNASKWNNECYLNINFNDLKITDEVCNLKDGKVEIKVGDVTFFSYVLQGLESVLECGVRLEKPTTIDKIVLPLQYSEGLYAKMSRVPSSQRFQMCPRAPRLDS